MSGFVGSPFFNVNGSEDWRKLFIEKMNEFADTIESASSPIFMNAILAPYLSMVGFTELINRLDNQSMVTILREAAQVASETNTQGVVFICYLKNEMNIMGFDFTKGTTAMQKKQLNVPMDSVAGKMFIEISIEKELNEAAQSLSMSPLYQTTKILSGI